MILERLAAAVAMYVALVALERVLAERRRQDEVASLEELYAAPPRSYPTAARPHLHAPGLPCEECRG